MNKENRRIAVVIMACSLLFGSMFWIFSACLEYLYIREYFNSLVLHYPGSFMDSVFFNISSYSLYNRLLFLFGCIAGGVIVSFYVIRRIEAENALVHSEKQLKAIIDSAFDVKILVDREGRILKMNDKAAAYLKKGEDELAGSLLYDLLTDGRREKRKEQFENVLNTKMPVQFDEEFDGRFYRLIIYPVKDNGGDVSSVAVTLRDITPEKKIEEEIRQDREYLALAMTSAGITIWEMWEKTKKMVVMSPDEISGGFEKKRTVNSYRDFWDSVHPDDRDMIGDALKDHFEGRTKIYSALYRMKNPKGEWRWMNSFGKIVERDNEGSPVKLIGIRVDVTNLHEYRETVIKANKKLNLLSEITRHDILNQVTAIRLSEELLLAGDYLEKNSEEWDLFEIIFRATAMIEEQITFTKDYQNLGISSPGWQNVSELISRIEKDANLMNIEITDNTGGLEIYADPMFEKVLFNILDNSSRHGGAKRITAWYELNKKRCTLIIEDDGCGIEEDLKEKIFGRGFGRNTGIGLFLVREILDITGISIRETGIPGQGARFEILIPRAAFRRTEE
ncbi:PAS domain-containing sensor histidine kinase [Methanolacinia paynteri]|uniref:PAS domain-containing sensor histidine kinase n=1 Tax=Methanolacinia paynteri TaxID=230356 RepID=UPI0006933DD4|nr:PAS domain S-box protein [Methanolacinia paynteri]